MTSLVQSTDTLASEVAASLVAVDGGDNNFVITLPILYPGGAHVLIRVDGDGRYFIVSDDGRGLNEAELMGGQRVFARLASSVASLSAIRFEEGCFFESGVSRAGLRTAVIAIATASKSAVDQTAIRLSERPYRHDDLELVERLVSIFGTPSVHRHAEILGASNKRWDFTAAVETDGHQTVFDLVKPHWQSILPAVVKFRDVSDLIDAPRRVAVVSDPDALDPNDLNLLSRTASVIAFNDRDDRYLRVA